MLGMILAAGLGTRLAPLTSRLPKPAVPVANRPLAAFAYDRLRALPLRELRANGHHLADAMGEAFARLDPELRFYPEARLLGTGGGLRNALFGTGEDALVVNGDVIFDVDLEAALALHRAHEAFATMVVRADARAEAMGAVRVDDAGIVRAIAGRPSAPDATTAYAFTGVHVLSARAIAALPEEGCVIRGGYQRWLASGERVVACVSERRWADLGTHAAYLEASVALASGAWAWPGIVRDARGVVHPEAELRDVLVRDSVVGDGVRAAAGVEILRSVVWPGSVIEESVRDAIVTPFVTLVPG